ncbi:hypothetical protein KM295_15310 [Natronomonas sp. F2-12]|jgi:hypothetical protein|uniref:Uncharacterized protein n=1 Tax=Natronomonas aquatica TaxID=2841590 RepID=A0A9R1D7H2_9EURY|nr:hypothetical protein [Natronomonas aquatica]MCQ4334822.1 hypothetical protein [Natronomonas aquatica]
MADDVSRRTFLGAAAALSTLPAVGGTTAATDGGDQQRAIEDLTASGIFVNADLGKASFRAEPDDLEEIDVRVRYDYHDVIFSVEATNDASDRAGTLLELKPAEAEAIAAQLVEAAEEYRADGQEGR